MKNMGAGNREDSKRPQRNCPLYCAFAAGVSRATPRLTHRLSITGNDIAGRRSSRKPPNLQAMSGTVKIAGSAVVCRRSAEDEPDRVGWLDHFSPSMTTQGFSLRNNSLKNRLL
jgi:hypothetical protein